MNNGSTAPVLEETVIPYLCGGTFFSLLLRLAVRNDSATGKKISDREVFKGLTEAVTGLELTTPKNTLGIYTSYYRSCKDISYNTPLKDVSAASQYHYEVLNSYDAVSSRMAKFVLDYLDPGRKEILVRSIVDLIKTDSTILPSQRFYVCSGETYSTKFQIEVEHSFSLAPFLIGVMHFILTERLSTNQLGAATLKVWDKPSDPAQADTGSFQFGASITHPVFVTIPSAEPSPERTGKTLPAPLNRTPLDVYLHMLTADLMEVHTVINQGQPAKFDDIYIDTDLMLASTKNSDSPVVLSNVTVPMLEQFGRRIKIIGTGGVGKTMLIRSLFAKQVKDYETSGVFPIFIEPRSFSSEYPTLIDYMVEAMHHYSKDVSAGAVKTLLDCEKAILFFDGVDEMTEANREVFQNRIDTFRTLYPNITVIITSRPPMRDRHFPGFITFEAQKLTKQQAIALIRKITYWDRDAKDRFVVELEKGLFEAHQDYCGIPLFLVILLATYRTYGSVPTAPHEFFELALKTMLGLHDVLKHGYRRRMYCSLESEEFLSYFSEFCYRAYSHNMLEFSDDTFDKYMSEVLLNRKIATGASSDDFLNDATEGVCIMYKEARKYHFLHRSFIEYLAALHLSRHIVGNYPALKAYWDKRPSGWDDDHTFDMLYSMKQDELDSLLFLPFFEEKLRQYGQGDLGYWQFLCDMYPSVIISNMDTSVILEYGTDDLKEELGDGSADGRSTSFLYNFFKKAKRIDHTQELNQLDWSMDEMRFFGGCYIEKAKKEDEDGNRITVFFPTAPIPLQLYMTTHTCHPRYLFTLSSMMIKNGTNSISLDLYEKLTDPLFPLRQEYDELCAWVGSARRQLDIDADYQSIVDSLC